MSYGKPKKALKTEAIITGVLLLSVMVFAFEPTRQFLLENVIESQYKNLETFKNISQALKYRVLKEKDLVYIMNVLDNIKRKDPGFILIEDVDLLKATAYRRWGKTRLAEELYNGLLMNSSDPLIKIDSALNLSSIYEQRGQLKKAIRILLDYKDGNPSYMKNEISIALSRLYSVTGNMPESGKYILDIVNISRELKPFYVRVVEKNWNDYSRDEKKDILKRLADMRCFEDYARLAGNYIRAYNPDYAETEKIALLLVYNCREPFVRDFIGLFRDNDDYSSIYEEMYDLYYLAKSTIRSHSGAVRGSYYQKFLTKLNWKAKYDDRKAIFYYNHYLEGEIDREYIEKNLDLVIRDLLAYKNYGQITNLIGKSYAALGLDPAADIINEQISFWNGYASFILGDLETAFGQFRNTIAKNPDGYYALQARDYIDGILKLRGISEYEFVSQLKKNFYEGGDTQKKLYNAKILYTYLTGTDREILREKVIDITRKFNDNAYFDFHDKIQNRIKSSENYIKFVVHTRFGFMEKAKAILTSAQISDPTIQDFVILKEMVRDRNFNGALPLYNSLADNGFVRDNFPFLSRDLQEILYPTPFEGEISLAISKLDKVNLDRYLVYAIIRGESMYISSAYSSAGAKGLMQIMPSTARIIAPKYLDQKGPMSRRVNLFNPMNNIILGTAYLNSNVESYGLLQAVACYNGGNRIVDYTRVKFSPASEVELMELIPFQETRDYVRKILTYYVRYKNIYDRNSWNAQGMKQIKEKV